jgi:cobalt/nickel transport system permease protein
LAEEAGRILLAYRLRAPGRRVPSLRECGALAGQWLLRTLHRVQRVDAAMGCRGFTGTWPLAVPRRWQAIDAWYMLAWCGFFALVRCVNLPAALGGLVERMF